ncbi:hypothetical protein GQ42DRAFT_65784 [Ramicandelaber brevisporus]|nr:hypothetical protein GQ42DRAFT_65784 [Ramicandelaber brevisporus]
MKSKLSVPPLFNPHPPPLPQPVPKTPAPPSPPRSDDSEDDQEPPTKRQRLSSHHTLPQQQQQRQLKQQQQQQQQLHYIGIKREGMPVCPPGYDLADYQQFKPANFIAANFLELFAMQLWQFNLVPVEVIVDEQCTYVASVRSSLSTGERGFFSDMRALVFKDHNYSHHNVPVLESIFHVANAEDQRAIAKVYRVHVQLYPRDQILSSAPRKIDVYLQDLFHPASDGCPEWYNENNISKSVQSYDVFFQMAKCLFYLSRPSFELVHGNISPSNFGWVLNTRGGKANVRPRWCLIDFTASRWVLSEDHLVAVTDYSPGFDAPENSEQTVNEFADHNPRETWQLWKYEKSNNYVPVVCTKSDVYSMAKVLEWLFPELVDVGKCSDVSDEIKLAQELRKLLDQMLNINIRERPSGEQLLKQLNKVWHQFKHVHGMKLVNSLKLSS